MKRPKKDGNRHLMSAFTIQTIDTLCSKLIDQKFQEGSPCNLLQTEFCESVKNSGLKQIALLKKVGDAFLAQTRINEKGIEIEKMLECFAFLFIKCRSKHPVRRTIASVIHGLPDSVKPLATDFLTENLSLELSDDLQSGQDFHDVFKVKIETLMALTENFQLGKFVIRNCFYEGLKFLLIVLQEETSCSRSSSSIDIQSAAMSNCLSALKAVIAVLNCELVEQSHQHTSEWTAIHEGVVDTLCNILEYSTDILQDSLFMLDCRSTAGIAIVSILQSLVPEEALQYILILLLAEHVDAPTLRDKITDIIKARDMNEQDNSSLLVINKILRIVLGIMQLQRENFRFSKLIICHGLVTKLSSKLLHGKGDCKEFEKITLNDKHVISVSNQVYDGLRNTNNGKSSSFLFVDDKLVQDLAILTISDTSISDIDYQSALKHPGKEEADFTRTYPCPVVSTSSQSLFVTFILKCLLDNCATVNQKGMTVYAYRTLYSWTVEALGHCKKLRESGSLQSTVAYSPQNDVTGRLIFTLNSYLDHPVDAVRHQVRNSLENLIRIINLFPDAEFHLQRLLSLWLDGNLRSRSKCLSLVCISEYISIERFLEIRKSLPLDLLDCLNDSNLASHICDLYVKSASRHKSEIINNKSDTEIWVHVWCEPVCKALSSCDPLRRSYITDYIVPGLLKIYPMLISLILDRSRRIETCEDYIVTSIVFLSSSRSLQECSSVKLHDQVTDASKYWHGLIQMDYMEICLLHIDDQIRLDCLSLICESNRSTEILRQEDFELLKLFIPLNMTSQSPKFRSQFVNCVKKAVSRVSDRCRQINRLIQLGEHSKNINNAGSSDGDNYLRQCEAFLSWLLEFLLLCLHDDANFPRMVTALEIISTVLKIITQDALPSEACASSETQRDVKCLFHTAIKKVFNRESIETLINCLSDTYDVNRSLATDILLILPRDIYTLGNDALIALLDQAIDLAYSPQPDIANTSPHIISFLANSSLKDDVKRAIASVYKCIDAESGVCVHGAHLIMLKILTRKLLEQVELAEEQLSRAALEAPMHGTIHCIRELLGAVQIKDVSDKRKWKGLVDELIKLCLRVRNIAGPVIQNIAPEGNIDSTGDHNVMISQIVQEDEEGKTDIGTQAYLSQMLLVCCWRSMKEAVLLLGHIVSCFPISPVPRSLEVDDGLPGEASSKAHITTDQILSSVTAIEIGNVFIDILSSSRHIGAFELAYLGFVKVCHTFWRSDIDYVEALPKKWISDLLETLKSDDPPTVLCSTRRSAGIPFFISAICSTEPPINKRRTFNMVMQVLTDICRAVQDVSESKEDESMSQKVICLNILRAMFKDSKFGEDVFPYASDGLMIAIKGFASHIWAIRNASTLLFSALLSRVFGAKKFPMSGTEFFSRFSPLYAFMKTEMEDITSHISRQGNQIQLHPSVFPLLMLLSHLYTSSMDGNDSKMTLSVFVPHIIRCGNSGVYKTRVMAARALASIITPDQLIETLNSLISTLPQGLEDKFNHNRVNGSLLQIQKLLEDKIADDNVSSSLKKEIINGPLIAFEKHLVILSSQEKCSFNKACFLEIINDTILVLGEEDWNSLTENTKTTLLHIIRACLDTIFHELDLIDTKAQNIFSLQRKVGHELLRKAAGNFLKMCFKSSLFRDILNTIDKSEGHQVCLASKLVQSNFCDIRKSALDWIATDSWTEIEDASFQELLQQRLLWDEKEAECLAGICNVLAMSSRSREFPWTPGGKNEMTCFQVWDRLKVRLGDFGKRDSLISAIQRLTLVFISYLHKEIMKKNTDSRSIGTDFVAEILDFVGQSCQAEESTSSRLSAARIIGDHVFLELFTDERYINSQNVHLVFKYWKFVIDLLQDEDSNIRSHMSTSVFPFIKNVCTGSDFHAFSRCSNLPSAFCIQPSYSIQMIITSIGEFYARFSIELCNFFMSFVIGKEDKSLIGVHEKLVEDKSQRRGVLLNEKRMEYAVIFESSDANTYKEEVTLAHFAFEELQNLILRHEFDEEVLHSSFIGYISHTLETWSEDPRRFLDSSKVKTACHVLMGFCIVCSLKEGVTTSKVLEIFTKFHTKLGEYMVSKSVTLNCILQSHLTTACWFCGSKET